MSGPSLCPYLDISEFGHTRWCDFFRPLGRRFGNRPSDSDDTAEAFVNTPYGDAKPVGVHVVIFRADPVATNSGVQCRKRRPAQQ
jgi:hypothetical protein